MTVYTNKTNDGTENESKLFLESILRMESERVQVLLNKDADRILSHSQLII